MVKVMNKPVDAKADAKKASQQNAAAPDFPAEGPHARPDLVNEAATPGSGLFSSSAKGPGADVDPGAG